MEVVDTNSASAQSSIGVNEEILKLRQDIQQSMRDLENKISKLPASNGQTTQMIPMQSISGASL